MTTPSTCRSAVPRAASGEARAPGRLEPGAERGSITVLGLGFGLVALLLIAVGVDATALQLRRTELWNLADGAALATADALHEPGYFTDGLTEGRLPLPEDRLVQQEAERYLTQARPGAAAAPVRLVAARVDADGTVVVTLATRARLPLSGPLFAAWAGGVDLAVTARGRSG